MPCCNEGIPCEDELVREKEAMIQLQARYEEALSILTTVAPQFVSLSSGQNDGVFAGR